MSFIVNLFRIVFILIHYIIYKIANLITIEYKIVNFLDNLGPTFVKFGQALSVRPDIIGEKIAQELTDLQDNMAPFCNKKAYAILQKELGLDINELFAEISPRPIAAASISQVYKATLITGEEVAVKILRPNIKKAFAKDINLLLTLAKIISVCPYNKRLKLKESIEIFKKITAKELDLRIEAAASSQLRENRKNDPTIHIPKIYLRYTTDKIMISEWVDAIKINNLTLLTHVGYDLKLIAKNLYINFLNQAYKDGFFHGDFHPGNILIDKLQRIVHIDCGITGSLDDKTKYYVTEILRGFLIRDYLHVAKIHFKAGYVPVNTNIYDFALACRAIGEPILNLPVKEISIAKLLSLLFKITSDFKMPTQPQLLLLQKNLVLVEGICKNLDPEINLWESAGPWVEDYAKQHYNLKNLLKNKLELIKEDLLLLPERLEKLGRIIDNYNIDKVRK